jgi:hypothetical protein
MGASFNPPAFPHVTQSKRAGSDTIYTHVSEGMTLRDWFAGQALVSFGKHDIALDKHLADRAYALADAMLIARRDQSTETGRD